MWVAQGKYFSDLATESSKGFYFSYFWAFYMSSQIFGNLLASYLLGSMGQSAFFFVMGLISFLSSLSFLFLKPPLSNSKEKEINQVNSNRNGEDENSNKEEDKIEIDLDIEL